MKKQLEFTPGVVENSFESAQAALLLIGTFVEKNVGKVLEIPYFDLEGDNPKGRLNISSDRSSIDRRGDGPASFQFKITLAAGLVLTIGISEGSPSISLNLGDQTEELKVEDGAEKIAPIVRKLNRSLLEAVKARNAKIIEEQAAQRTELLDKLGQF